MKNLKGFIQKNIDIIVILIFTVAWNQGAYNGGRLIASSWYHYDMTLPIDDMVPLVPWTIVIYFGCYLFWALNYYICAKQTDIDERNRYFCADAMSKIVCFIFFLALPTTNVRPELTGGGVWEFILGLLYKIDAADNLFPSIHCLVSWFCWIGVRKRKDISVFYRYFSLLAALAVCVSTITTKQHVWVDVISGVLLAELCYALAGIKKVRDVYGRFITWLIGLFKSKKKTEA